MVIQCIHLIACSRFNIINYEWSHQAHNSSRYQGVFCWELKFPQLLESCLINEIALHGVFGELHFSPHLWIGPPPFFKGSLTWENNAIFSPRCFTLRERRHSAFNSETDHKLKLSKTHNLCAVELPPCLVLELASRPPLSDARSRAAFEPIEMCTRSVFLVQIFWRTSVQYNSGVQTDCVYNGCIQRF